MEYQFLGRSNLTVSKICLGTMHFGVHTEEKDAFAIMDRALELGINFFDTANVYGRYGKTEEIMGRWFALGGGRREKVVLATKVYGEMTTENWPNEHAGFSAHKIRRHLKESMQRLQTDHIDLYQVHHYDRNVPMEEFWGSLEKTINDGDVSYLGSSNFPAWGLTKFQLAAQQRQSLGFISEQTQYNLMNRAPELELLPACDDLGIGIMAYMPMAGGLLTSKSRQAKGPRTTQVEEEYEQDLSQHTQLDAFSSVCNELGEKEEVVATAWVLHQQAVSTAICGVRTMEHLDGIVRAAEVKLDDEVLEKLNVIFDINKGRPLRSGKPAPEAYAW